MQVRRPILMRLEFSIRIPGLQIEYPLFLEGNELATESPQTVPTKCTCTEEVGRGSQVSGFATRHREDLCAQFHVELLQLRVLGFGLLQDRNIRVGVFPELEEIFVDG